MTNQNNSSTPADEVDRSEGVFGLRPYEFYVAGKSLRWYMKRDVDAILAARAQGGLTEAELDDLEAVLSAVESNDIINARAIRDLYPVAEARRVFDKARAILARQPATGSLIGEGKQQQAYGYIARARDGHETYFKGDPATSGFHDPKWQGLMEIVPLYIKEPK